MSFLSFVQRTFYWHGKHGLSGEKGLGTGEKSPPFKFVISRIKLKYFSTFNLTQIFEEIFHQFPYSTTTFLDFSKLAFQSSASKDKKLKELDPSKLI